MRPTAFVRFVAFQVFQILNHHRPIRFCPMDKKSEKEKSKLARACCDRRNEKRKRKTCFGTKLVSKLFIGPLVTFFL